MSIDTVRAYLKQYGLDKDIQEFSTSSATVALAAEALGCEENRIAKTLSFMVANVPVLIVTAGDVKIDNKKYKEQFGVKAKMLSPEEVLQYVGHPVGGVCPFAVKDGVRIYLDESLRRFDVVYPACGSANSAIRLPLHQLEECSHSLGWIDVSKPRV
ncbi:MAG: YbaK/EbsC family protein [Ruminococcaceae bacterium]|nr:YbaK/EbsC family protein [Oscillospiraceae bacterium]